ncbi:(2Fe-2S)-binding protein [Mesorhizobium sp. CAU 1732]|uniref:(2Fe-2S)-binding protein n=1 Tax=Mesorhizobium sp. CAU 1732 TaxID=3140358 RepID=UPI0032617889
MINLRVNNQDVEVDVPGNATLLAVLSNDLKLRGQKFGCGVSQCGACTVLIDGEPVKSCQTPVTSAIGRSVTTLEGLRDSNGGPGALQQAFIEEQAAQCGYCTSGMIVAAQALLDRNASPTESDIRIALSGNLCRCGSHNRVVRAVLKAAGSPA